MRYLVMVILFCVSSLGVMAQDTPPVIHPGQTRVALSSYIFGDTVGDNLTAGPSATAWSVISEDNGGSIGGMNELFFTISNSGQISVLQPLNTAVVAYPITVTLTVRAYNNVGASADEIVTIHIYDTDGSGLVIGGGQNRFVLSNTDVGANVGAPIHSTGAPDTWFIAQQTNPIDLGNGLNERFFEIDFVGQLTVGKPLSAFFPPGSGFITVTLTIFAINNGGASDPVDVTITIAEAIGAGTLEISPGQNRSVLSSSPTGANVGSPIHASGGAEAWTIVNEVNPTSGGIPLNEIFFDIDSNGQLLVAQPLDSFFPGTTAPVVVTLTLQAFDGSGASLTEDVSVTILEDTSGGGGGVIVTAGQRRSIISSASVGDSVGSPLFATGVPVSWDIVSESNPTAGGVPANELFFDIDATGQVSVAQTLAPFFPGTPAPVEVVLTVRAVNNSGVSPSETVTITIIEDTGGGGSGSPVIAAGQSRNVLSSSAVNDPVGSPVFSSGAALAWTIVSETNPTAGGVPANEIFFAVDNGGQITVAQGLDAFFPGTPAPVVITLTLRAFNDSGPSADETITITIIEDSGASLSIPAGQSRNIISSADIGAAVGDPLAAAGSPTGWSIANQINPAVAGIGTNERFFDIDNQGQITVLKSLEPFFPEARGLSTTVTLTVEAVNDEGGNDQEDITIFIQEGDKPSIPGGQIRSIPSDVTPGSAIGDPIYADPAATYWTILAGNDEGAFDIDNSGLLTTNFFLDTVFGGGANPLSLTLTVQAGNETGLSAPTDIEIVIRFVGRCGYISPSQTRFVSAVATEGTTIGGVIDFHEIDAMWIQETYVDNGLNPDEVSTAFNVTSAGQISVLRSLGQFFPADSITKVQLVIRGHITTAGCTAFADEIVNIYVLPDTIASPDPDAPDDFSAAITDITLRACIREALGGVTQITANDVLSLDRLDCHCLGVVDLDGLNYFRNLVFLTLSNNMIQDIRPLASLILLEDLRLSGNLITDVENANPLASLEALRNLDLSNNQIRNTNAFSTLSAIEFLSLSDNNVCDITSLVALADSGALSTGDTVHLDGNHLTSTQAIQDIGTIETAGAFVSAFGQTSINCSAPFSVVQIEGWPFVSVLDFARIMEARGGCPQRSLIARSESSPTKRRPLWPPFL